jgi:DNA invertase Pin-like site-specific DNA recombinase
MFTIIGTVAEIEATLISERVQAGMQAAEGGGTHVGAWSVASSKRPPGLAR